MTFLHLNGGRWLCQATFALVSNQSVMISLAQCKSKAHGLRVHCKFHIGVSGVHIIPDQPLVSQQLVLGSWSRDQPNQPTFCSCFSRSPRWDLVALTQSVQVQISTLKLHRHHPSHHHQQQQQQHRATTSRPGDSVTRIHTHTPTKELTLSSDWVGTWRSWTLSKVVPSMTR